MNAQEARKTAIEYSEEALKETIERIEKSISGACFLGRFSIDTSVQVEIRERVRVYFEALGYTVSNTDLKHKNWTTGSDHNTITISW